MYCRQMMCTGLVELSHDAITTQSAKPQKNLKVFFQVMAYIHLINKDTEPFAKCERDPETLKWKPIQQIGFDHLVHIVSNIEG